VLGALELAQYLGLSPLKPVAELLPGKAKRRKPMDSELRAELVEQMAEEMIKGWSLIARNEHRRKLEKEYDMTKDMFAKLERDAQKVLTDSWDQVTRQDLVARNLHRLEFIAQEAIRYRQMSVAQACIQSMNRAVGADRPAEN
jgi:hypothetical protein